MEVVVSDRPHSRMFFAVWSPKGFVNAEPKTGFVVVGFSCLIARTNWIDEMNKNAKFISGRKVADKFQFSKLKVGANTMSYHLVTEKDMVYLPDYKEYWIVSL